MGSEMCIRDRRRCQEKDKYNQLRKRYEGDVFNNLKAFIDSQDHHSTKAKNIHNSIKNHCNPTSILGYVPKKEESYPELRRAQVEVLHDGCISVWGKAEDASRLVDKISSCLGVMNKILAKKKEQSEEQSEEDLIIGAFLRGRGGRMGQARYLLDLCAWNDLYFFW